MGISTISFYTWIRTLPTHPPQSTVKLIFPQLLGSPTSCPPLAGFLNPPTSTPTHWVGTSSTPSRSGAFQDSLIKRRTHRYTLKYPSAFMAAQPPPPQIPTHAVTHCIPSLTAGALHCHLSTLSGPVLSYSTPVLCLCSGLFISGALLGPSTVVLFAPAGATSAPRRSAPLRSIGDCARGSDGCQAPQSQAVAERGATPPQAIAIAYDGIPHPTPSSHAMVASQPLNPPSVAHHRAGIRVPDAVCWRVAPFEMGHRRAVGGWGARRGPVFCGLCNARRCKRRLQSRPQPLLRQEWPPHTVQAVIAQGTGHGTTQTIQSSTWAESVHSRRLNKARRWKRAIGASLKRGAGPQQKIPCLQHPVKGRGATKSLDQSTAR